MTTSQKTYYKGGYLVKNIKNDNVVFVDTAVDIAHMIPEVSQMTILRYLRMGGVQRISTTLFLLKRADDDTPWQAYEEARSYRAKGPRQRVSTRAVKCWDTETDEITHYPNPKFAIEALGFAPGLVYQSLAQGKTNKKVGMVDARWVFRFEEHEFPSLQGWGTVVSSKRSVPQAALVKYVKTGEVKLYRSRERCLQDTGLAFEEFKRAMIERSQRVAHPDILVKPVYDNSPWLK